MMLQIFLFCQEINNVTVHDVSSAQVITCRREDMNYWTSRFQKPNIVGTICLLYEELPNEKHFMFI